MRFKIPREVKIVSWSTAILWFGWGFGEALIPVFLYQFSNSYAETGLLKSAFDIVALLVTPVIGYYADKISIKKMMLVGIGLYFLVSFSYFLAGTLACALFVVFARVLNGISWPLTCTSRESYICKYTPENKMTRAFGYFDTLGNLAWVLAVCLSLFLVSKLAIHQLLLLIAPAAVLSFIVALFLPNGTKLKKIKRVRFSLAPYKESVKEVLRWPLKLRTVVLSGFLVSFVSSAFFFFIPIEVWKNDSDLKQIIILAIFYSLPEVFGDLLGWVIDRIKVGKSLVISFAGIFVILVCSIFFNSFLWRLSALILVGIFAETISLAQRQLIADFNVKNNLIITKTRYSFGGINAILDEITSMGGFIGIILIGIIIDSGNWPTALALMALILIYVFGVFIRNNIIDKKNITL